MDSALRRIGSELLLAAAATQRVIFGPFLPFAEKVNAAFIVLFPVTGVVPVVGDYWNLEVRAFNVMPLDTTADFVASGRQLHPPSPVVGDGFLAFPPSATCGFRVALNFRPIPGERFLGFWFRNSTGGQIRGNITLEVDDTIYEKPEATGDVTSLEK